MDQACSYLSTLSFASTALVTFVASTQSGNENVSYTNPILPGWNSDPSCVFVAERDNTFFCTTSSFLAYPGAPIHPSKDLINWKLASNVINRPEQLPTLFFISRDATNDSAWSMPFAIETPYIIDPGIFSDDDRSIVVADVGHSIKAKIIDVKARNLTETFDMGNGTGNGFTKRSSYLQEGWLLLPLECRE
ncbi:hypothetical protein D6D15_04464 [Aureobasidium pullulans]|uniref:Arabinanase/levansucrase/invertase n=1 Tax=Aureobasidium pullulans TaxID=5580 RepID=A0A4V4IVS9_AURPU|nr:hypothetical protein D6D15_04464 [Aureobasidium pullulans]